VQLVESHRKGRRIEEIVLPVVDEYVCVRSSSSDNTARYSFSNRHCICSVPFKASLPRSVPVVPGPASTRKAATDDNFIKLIDEGDVKWRAAMAGWTLNKNGARQWHGRFCDNANLQSPSPGFIRQKTWPVARCTMQAPPYKVEPSEARLGWRVLTRQELVETGSGKEKKTLCSPLFLIRHQLH
jgi:hypothetical protein